MGRRPARPRGAERGPARAGGRAARAGEPRPDGLRAPLRGAPARRGHRRGGDQAAAAEGRRRPRSAASCASSGRTEIPQAAEVDRGGLAPAWEAALATLPPDWSDLLCEIELTSSDYLQRAALLLAPVNPAKTPDRSAFRFRVARRFGYGASPAMTRRCLERLDEEGIVGHVSILRALSDTHNVATQGPVWYVEGKAV